MSISDWADLDTTPHYLRDEVTPYVLPIVVRLEKENQPCHEEAILGAAQAMVKFLADSRNEAEGEWNADTMYWLQGRIRKIVKRARGAAWDKVLTLPGVYVKYGKAELYLLPPCPADEQPAEIRKLQVSGLVLPYGLTDEPASSALCIALNPEVSSMSTGKSIAQACHAAQLAVFNSTREELSAWEAAGYPVKLTTWDSFKNWLVEIQDAGFTEVEPGTVTARAQFA